MQAVFVQKGETIDYLAPVNVKSGDIVVLGDLVGVVQHDAVAGEKTSVALTGVFAFPRITGGGTAMSLGSKVYWSPDYKLAFNSPGGSNALAGHAIEETLDDAPVVRVRLGH